MSPSAFNHVPLNERREAQCNWLIKISKNLMLPRENANFSLISPFITPAMRNILIKFTVKEAFKCIPAMNIGAACC